MCATTGPASSLAMQIGYLALTASALRLVYLVTFSYAAAV